MPQVRRPVLVPGRPLRELHSPPPPHPAGGEPVTHLIYLALYCAAETLEQQTREAWVLHERARDVSARWARVLYWSGWM